MQVLDLAQGSAPWLAHRATARNAGDASAMLGCSPYQTRSELLQVRHTGIRPEVLPDQQRRFDRGHAIEAAKRAVAEAIIGEYLYPCVGTEVLSSNPLSGDDGIELSASFDGLTMLEDTNWECKSLNDDLRAALPNPGPDGNDAANLPKHYRVQMQQQCMVSGAKRVLFTASDGQDDDRHCWFYPDADLAREILAGWRQFDADLAAYVPVEVLDRPAVVGRSPDQLPALRSSVKGELVLESNIKEWEAAALEYIKSVRDHELKTDQDFENADAAAKWCDTSKATLLGVKASLMSATGDVNMAVGTLDRIAAELDKTRIAFTNAIKARKEARKGEIVAGGIAALRKHVDGLNQRLGQAWMPAAAAVADFAGAIKGKSSLAKMEDAVATTLANAKIAANETADRIARNREDLKPGPGGIPGEDWISLFPDFAQVCTKAPEDFHNLRVARVEAERQRRADERARIRAEEAAKLQREQEARDRAAAAEAARIAATPAPTQPPAAAPIEPPAVSSQAANVVPMGTRAPDTGARIKLGEINARLAPIAITADGLAVLGFHPVATEKAAKLYAAGDFQRICSALIAHVSKVSGQQRAA